MGQLKYMFEQNNLNSVGFWTNSKNKTMLIRFWEGARLADIEFCSKPRDIPVVNSDLKLISLLQSTVGTDP